MQRTLASAREPFRPNPQRGTYRAGETATLEWAPASAATALSAWLALLGLMLGLLMTLVLGPALSEWLARLGLLLGLVLSFALPYLTSSEDDDIEM